MPNKKSNKKIKVYKKCCVGGCFNRTSIAHGVRFFKFPCNRKSKNIFQKWCRNVRVDPTTLNTFSMVCSEHFLPQFLTYGKTKVNLKRGAIPTVNLPQIMPYKIIANSTKSSTGLKTQNTSGVMKIKFENDLFETTDNFEDYIKCSYINQIETNNDTDRNIKSNNLYINDANESNSMFRKSGNSGANVQVVQISKNNKINFSQVNNYKTKILSQKKIIVAENDLDTKLINFNVNNNFTRMNEDISNETFETFETNENDEIVTDDDIFYEFAHMHEEVIDINSNSEISDDDIECLDCIEDCECNKNKKNYTNWMDENDFPAEYLEDALYEMINIGNNVQNFNESTTKISKNDAADVIKTKINFQNRDCIEDDNVTEYDVDVELQRIEDTLKVLQQRKSLLKNEKTLMENKRRTIK